MWKLLLIHIFAVQMTGRQKHNFTQCSLLVMACCLQNISDYWNDDDRSWKNATTTFSLHTIIFMMTWGEKRQSFASHFCFLDDRNWKRATPGFVWTLSLSRWPELEKTETFMSPLFLNSWSLSSNKSQGSNGSMLFPRAGMNERPKNIYKSMRWCDELIMKNLIIPAEEVCLITLHCYLGTSVFAKIDVFLAVQNSSIGDLVTHSLTH